MEPPVWIDIASKFGVPVVILLAVGYGLWKFGRWAADRVDKTGWWIANELVIPLRDRFIKQADQTHAWMQALGLKLEQISEENSKHHIWEEERMDEFTEKLNGLAKQSFNWAKPPSDPKKVQP